MVPHESLHGGDGSAEGGGGAVCSHTESAASSCASTLLLVMGFPVSLDSMLVFLCVEEARDRERLSGVTSAKCFGAWESVLLRVLRDAGKGIRLYSAHSQLSKTTLCEQDRLNLISTVQNFRRIPDSVSFIYLFSLLKACPCSGSLQPYL